MSGADKIGSRSPTGPLHTPTTSPTGVTTRDLVARAITLATEGASDVEVQKAVDAVRATGDGLAIRAVEMSIYERASSHR